ncbi:MAG TPA: hypothetical protein VFK02_36265 [Kofleriaceae bacterium]|nr:hypothetical protein [Kofleriaceae bacterium]
MLEPMEMISELARRHGIDPDDDEAVVSFLEDRADQISRAEAEPTLLRVVRALRAPIVPRHPVLDALLDAVEAQGATALQALWRPFLEPRRADRVDVTFRVRRATEVSTFSFKYRAPRSGGNPWLYACTGGTRGLSDVAP